jgi:hypothetical protein
VAEAIAALVLTTAATGGRVELKTLVAPKQSLFEASTEGSEDFGVGVVCNELMQTAVILKVSYYEAPHMLQWNWDEMVAPGGALYPLAVPAQAALLLFINAVVHTFGRSVTEADKW